MANQSRILAWKIPWISFFQNRYSRVIHNGVDINIFSPQNSLKGKYGNSEKFVILGVCSVWIDKKGLPDFFRLREKLSENYEIILIGMITISLKTY